VDDHDGAQVEMPAAEKIIAAGPIPPVAGKETGLRLRTMGVGLLDLGSS
jgi:hypothetical protein